jgi:hypothetical protein
VSNPTLGDLLIQWARGESSVSGLVLIGSQVRSDGPGVADTHSDWDFQIVTTRPKIFDGREWVAELNAGEPLAYAVRLGRLGAASKVSIAFPLGELDLVIISAAKLRVAKWLAQLGLAGTRSSLVGLANVLRDGYRIIKGETKWGNFFRYVATEIAPPRLSDEDVHGLAEGFVVDYISTHRKIERGEFLAAQRWLHHNLVEVNFQLLHELRQRRGELSFPDARRVERVVTSEQLAAVAVSALVGSEALKAALEKSATTCRELVRQLLGNAWSWPTI